MREGINYPKFADKFYRLDFDATPMPVLCLYPIPIPVTLEDLQIEVCPLEKHPNIITWKALESLPRVKLSQPLICQIFNWSEVVEWEGIKLVDVLDFLKLETHPEGYYAFYSRDGIYFETLSRDEARDPRVLLAFGLNGSPLPENHGGPLRLVVPFLQGYKSVKWIGAIRAFRNDPAGIKRLLGQSPTGQLNESWRERFQIAPSHGKAGDPPAFSPNQNMSKEVSPQEKTITLTPTQGTIDLSGYPAIKNRIPSPHKQKNLLEIIAVVRPSRHLTTRLALEKAGVVSYTTYGVLGRSKQRGLRFKSELEENQKDPVAIKFLPKHLFSIVVEESMVKKTVNAIIMANKTGRGQHGDGKIFILNIDQALRVSTDERGEQAV